MNALVDLIAEFLPWTIVVALAAIAGYLGYQAWAERHDKDHMVL